MVKAIKECPQCRSSIHAATKTCYCGYVFYKRRQRKVKGKKQEVDWRTLVSGDKIKIISSDYWEDKNGEAHFMGNSGLFEVFRVVSSGIVLYNKEGFAFQDMVSDGKSKTGITKCPPKIIKIAQGTVV